MVVMLQDNLHIVIPILVVAMLVLSPVIHAKWPISYDEKSVVKSDLEKNGYKYIAMRRPRAFRTGPFPKISCNAQGMETRIGGVREASRRRYIVVYKKDGHLYRSWVEVNYIAFKVQELVWKPGLGCEEIRMRKK